MRTAEVRVYTFEELSAEAQEKVIERYRQFAYEDTYMWFENMQEDAKESASFKIESLNDNPISGEGVCLIDAETTARTILENHGDVCETHKVATAFLEAYERLTAQRGSCEEQLDTLNDKDEWDAGDTESARQNEKRLEELLDEIEELENEFARSIGHEYGVLWSQEVEYQTSDEAIRENIEANEREFLEDGRNTCF